MTTALTEWDWVLRWRTKTKVDQVLHHLAATDEPWDETDTQGTGVTSCGLTGYVAIPGLGDRMGGPRCPDCCRVVGYPEGKGSPKNDEACRPLVEARIARRQGADR